MNGYGGWRRAHLGAFCALVMTSVLIGGSCTDVDTGSEDTDSAESDGPVGEAAQAVTWVPRPALTHPGSSHLGRRLAMSGDGLRIIAAGAYDTDVAVFTRTGLTWGATGATLNSSVNGCWGHFGESVAIDGTTAWVGAPVDVPSGGAACQFGLAANGWTFAAEVIEGAGGQHFGAYVALSGDHGISAKWLPPEGCVVSIWDVSDQPPTKLGGGTFADGGCGPVAIDGDIAVAVRWVGLPAPFPDVYSLSTFELSSAGVTSLGDSSLPDPFFQPSAMALSGQTLVIGYANESVADVFTRPPSGAWNLVEHWPSSGGQGFGYSVDVSDSHIVVGAPGDDDNGPDAGAVYVYKKAAGGDWVQDVKLTAGAQSGDLLGESVAVGGSPFPFVAAGAPFAGTDGEVFLYALTNENGAACASDLECTSSHCSDGVCCGTACNNPCDACSLAAGAQTDGTCANVADGSAGNPACAPYLCAGSSPTCPGSCLTNIDCVSGHHCDADNHCVAKLAPGNPCSSDGQCATGNCKDGVCCDTPCGGACKACNLAGSAGTCADIPSGQDPASECQSGACNGAGACELDNGQSCANGAACLSGHCADGVCCNTACNNPCDACSVAAGAGTNGTCANLADGSAGIPACAPYLCNGSSATCPGTCAADADCVGGDHCDGSGHCVAKKAQGQPCSSNGECTTGFCVEDRCCNTACNNPCDACSVAAGAQTDGTCANVADGGAGTPACAPYLCNGASPTCPQSCTSDADCVSGDYCDAAHHCVAKLAQGQGCSSNGQCASGSCADGVCCNTACGGACDACSVATGAQTNGTCAVLGDGSLGSPSCAPYLCDGSLAACPGSCTTDGDCVGGTYCDAAHHCVAKLAQGQGCSSNNQCASGSCADGVCCNDPCTGGCRACTEAKTTLASGTCGFVTAATDPDSECSGAAGDVCNGAGACSKSSGQACSAGTECLSGHCYDGTCCNAPCGGVCEACDLNASPGICTKVAAGADPDLECPGDTVCNGAGACTQLDQGLACTAGAECESGFCADGVCCDAVCGEPCKACVKVKTGFANGMCAAVIAGADPDDDCAGTGICNGGGACVAPLGESCAAGAACLSGSCVDGVCCDSACTDLCHACSAEKTNAPDGTCAPVQSGTADAECKADKACDGAGACKRVLGEQCTGGADCVSGFCADGVCCDTACDGTCETCKPASGGGACTPYPAGEDPEDECDGVIACGGDGACGPGLGLGETCALAAECESGFCADGSCCESACDGPCAACNSALTQQPDGACAPVDAGTDPDGECPGSEACDGAFACKPGTGVACTEGADCLSGFCVDGVCCDTACGGGDLHDCQACSAMAGGPKDGTCLPVTAEAAIVCRPAAAACDAAETCNGATIVCPGDEPAAAGEPCDDGDPLTADDACDGNGTCAGDTGCDDGNPCTQGDVWQLDGTCAGAMSPDGTPCDDGEVCTEDDICQSGVCSGDVAGACEPPETGWGGGGCMCSLPGDSPRPAGWIGLLAGLIGLAGLRLRRRAHAAGERRRSTATAHGNGDGARRRQGSRVVAGFSAPRTAARTGAPRRRRGPCLTA